MLLYTRSVRNDDYHWVYKDNNIGNEDITNIAFDHYHMTANWHNLELTLKQNSLYVRKLKSLKGFAVYKLFDTNIKDNCCSPIFALFGISFVGLSGQHFNDLLLDISSEFFKNLSGYDWQVKYKEKNGERIFALNLEKLLNITDQQVQETRVILKQYLCDNFCQDGFRIFYNGDNISIEKLTKYI